jgi:hypothetical protein
MLEHGGAAGFFDTLIPNFGILLPRQIIIFFVLNHVIGHISINMVNIAAGNLLLIRHLCRWF